MESARSPHVGHVAPPFHVRGARAVFALESLDGQPAVLAFFATWSPLDAPSRELDAVRAELRGLGAVLVVLSSAGLFVFRPDDEIETFAAAADLVAADVARAQVSYGVKCDARGVGPALFVVDGKQVLRFAHRWSVVDGTAGADAIGLPQLNDALAAAGRAILLTKRSLVLSRRELVAASLVAGFALVFLDACNSPPPAGRMPPKVGGSGAALPSDGEVELTLQVNGTPHEVRVDPRTTLLDARRERMALTGTKKGCDHGQCGACTVHLDGRRVNACLLFASMVEGQAITTIEGIARGDVLHPVQAAFMAEDALQCGYCTPGQIMSAVALLAEGVATSDDEVREMMSGNICRCGAYPNIVAAVQLARKGAP